MSDTPDRLNILEGIEAARPGSDDVGLPELSHVAEAIAADEQLEQRYLQVQQSDASLAKVFQEVDAPVGLQDRLLAALESQDSKASAASEVLPKPSTKKHTSVVPDRGSRRWLMASSIAASLLIALGLGFYFLYEPAPATEAQVEGVAQLLHAELPFDGWKSPSAQPGSRPACDQMQPEAQLVGWLPVEGLGDQHAIAYRYQRHDVTATLFVFRPRSVDPSLPTAPLQPATSSGVTVGVWRDGDLVYALIIDGNATQYLGFVRPAVPV